MCCFRAGVLPAGLFNVLRSRSHTLIVSIGPEPWFDDAIANYKQGQCLLIILHKFYFQGIVLEIRCCLVSPCTLKLLPEVVSNELIFSVILLFFC